MTQKTKKSKTSNLKEKSVKVTIVDKMNRSVLGEGRNYQMGFAFLKKTGTGTYETVQPISPCKDYLNDVVWSEAVDKPIYAYGLNYKKVGIFEGATKAYLVMKIMPSFGGTSYIGMDKDVKNLKENYQNLQKYINFFEEKLKLKVKTKIYPTDNDMFLVTFDKYWTTGTYLISLYTLILRSGQYYKTGDKLDYFKTGKGLQIDAYLCTGAAPKLEKLLNGAKVTQNLENLSGGTTVHNLGIIGFNM